MTKFRLKSAVTAIVIFAGVGVWHVGPGQALDYALQPDNGRLVGMGAKVYAENCASCHGVRLEGQANWRERDAEGMLPAPPHDESGHTWHHPDPYLFLVTKYGIEAVIGRPYANNMPAYEGDLSDEQIIAVLSYIKSQWPDQVRSRHDRINDRFTAQLPKG